MLIMQLIPELYRARTVTVFQTDAGGNKKNQTVKVNVCPAGPCIYLQTHINREANTGRRKVIREERADNNVHGTE